MMTQEREVFMSGIEKTGKALVIGGSIRFNYGTTL